MKSGTHIFNHLIYCMYYQNKIKIHHAMGLIAVQSPGLRLQYHGGVTPYPRIQSLQYHGGIGFWDIWESPGYRVIYGVSWKPGLESHGL